MILELRLEHGASPDPPMASCVELLRIAKLLGVVATLTINNKWLVFAHPADDLDDVRRRLNQLMHINP